jgi:hypothetical protein
VAAAQVAELSLGERFCGPPTSANGGYACGAIAELLSGGVEVTLRCPPPLDRPRRLRVGHGDGVVYDGDELVAEARPARIALATPGTASPAEARAASGWSGSPLPPPATGRAHEAPCGGWRPCSASAG